MSEMKRQLDDGDLKLDQKISLLNGGINGENPFVQADSGLVKTQF